jgi:predicted dehydrogenase
MVRIGIAGLGFMGMIHYLAAQELRGTGQVVAICTRDRKKLDGDWTSIKGNFGPAGTHMAVSHLKRFERFQDMIADPDIELIDICTPTDQHESMALAALKAGKHVLVEKAIALDVAAADRMVAAAKEANRQLFVGHVLPFFPEFAYAASAIKDGSFGKLLGGHFKRVISRPDWSADIGDASKTGGPAIDLHIHDTHFIGLVAGVPERVFSVGKVESDGSVSYLTTSYLYGKDGPAITCASGALAMKSRPFVHGYELYLEKATLVYESGSMPLTLLPADGSPSAVALPLAGELTAFTQEIQQAINALSRNQPAPLISAQLARDALSLCFKECESVRTGKVVELKDGPG